MYEEIMRLWRLGDIGPLANYLNSKGVYSALNTLPKNNRVGSYWWVQSEPDLVVRQHLIVLGIMFFPAELRYIDKQKPNRIKEKHHERRN